MNEAADAARAAAVFFAQGTLTMTTTSPQRLAELRRSITAEFSVTSATGKRLMAATYRRLRSLIASEKEKQASNARAASKRRALARSKRKLVEA